MVWIKLFYQAKILKKGLKIKVCVHFGIAVTFPDHLKLYPWSTKSSKLAKVEL